MLRDRHLKVVSIWTSGANENTDLDVPPPPPRELWKTIVEEEAVKNSLRQIKRLKVQKITCNQTRKRNAVYADEFYAILATTSNACSVHYLQIV